ncbi:MAG: 2-amino-4-hydroxy-6-hydroxymethyldihydropteridine diphosphokinase [Oscillospiraceae bacterium]|jgi:2-amino-4-hydroxy-6-hydroxymethyldihydropteridine diphosphokinase|nr:2-amino-4-hydroxy-6-hydroxymethyldihydropteridine diphosphokinase [Oscillospiraceae bacterium]
MKAILGLGTNMGDREGNLTYALQSLGRLIGTVLIRHSDFYITEPVEVTTQQDDYLNCVAEIETELSPEVLLGACLGIESAIGRVRVYDKAPRVIDIDLLIYEGETRCSEELTLPHNGIPTRAFVLFPLIELYPEGTALGYEFGGFTASVAGQRISRINRS